MEAKVTSLHGHPRRLTSGSNLREAYLSLVMAEETATLVEPAPTLEGEPPPGEVYR